MELLNNYTIEITVVLCLMVGYIIKQAMGNIKNEYIPLIVGVVGLIFNIYVNNFNISPLIIVQGLASGLASTGVFELKKNFDKLKNYNNHQEK